MAQLLPIMAASAAGIAVMMLALWLVSLAWRDASIVDLFWGPGFALVAWIGLAVGDGASSRQWLCAALTSVWALRLGGYLAWRNWSRGEDPRYLAMRQNHGERFGRVSLYTVFGFQGLIMWVVSLPIQQTQAAPEPTVLSWIEGAGVLLWAAGLCFESIGDCQLARFRADPANRGQVMDRGLWSWTRHPNYFGDALVWWGLFLLALPTPGGAWTLLSPALMTFMLVRISGVALLERDLRQSKPDYAAYTARTNAFLPWPPRRGGGGTAA
jgi:steroid 5-alpha reductase family enzyme